MADKEWKTVTLPDSLLEEVQKILDKEVLGYKTKSEFIKEAVRQRIIDLKKTDLYK